MRNRRLDYIKWLVKGKDVLDVGSVGENRMGQMWEFLNNECSCKTLIGIDLLPCELGGVFRGDIETYEFDRRFDVVSYRS